jgi:tRNA (guanine37-N1)-methyltransferase
MKFTFVTLFPNLISFYFQDSILKRAVDTKLITCEYKNPRDYTTNKHLKVDEYMVGGGAGLLMKAQPLYDLLHEIKRNDPCAHIIFPTPAGKTFKQNDARRLAKQNHLVLVSGRYEGIDERIIEEFADELFCMGDYILTGGELPSLVISDAVSRNIPGVLGNADSLAVESFEASLIEAPSFTKPNNFMGKTVVSEFLKGNHSKIADLKNGMSLCKTKFYRPDLYTRQENKIDN